MLQGILAGHGTQLADRPAQKWPARRGQNDASHLIAAVPAQRLEDGVVLAVQWKQVDAGGARRAGDQLARNDQHFLVGKRDILAGFDRAQGRQEPQRPHECRHHQLRGRGRRYLLQPLRPVSDRTVELRHQPPQLNGGRMIAHCDKGWSETTDLLS